MYCSLVHLAKFVIDFLMKRSKLSINYNFAQISTKQN